MKLLSRILRMKGFKATWCEINEAEGILLLGVKPHKSGCRCPHCGRRGKIVARAEVRQWDDVVVCGLRSHFFYAPHEILCPTHGRVQEQIHWAEAHSRISLRLQYLILLYCQIMTQKAAAKLLHMARSTLSDILHRTILRLREGHLIKDLCRLGIDEISYHKGKKFATIVYDLDRRCVVWVGKGKGRQTADEFFRDVLSAEQRSGIKFAACDMSKAYLGAIEHWCPNATLVIDRFHIVKALNKAMDAVRIQEWHKAKKADRKALKGLRWILSCHSRSRSKGHTRKLNALKTGNKRIHNAWVLKDEFEAFWEYQYTLPAETFFNNWIRAAIRSRIPSMKEFALTLRKHAKHILPFIKTKLTNAIAEGINRVIKIVKNRASGFAQLQAFTDMIFLTVGDLDLPAQIPQDFRTA